MPLFGTEYHVERTPEAMSYEAYFDNGIRLFVTPHLCSSHEGTEDHHHGDHRGLIDMTLFLPEPMFGILVPATMILPLPLASAFIEGLTEVAPYAQMNMEIGHQADRED